MICTFTLSFGTSCTNWKKEKYSLDQSTGITPPMSNYPSKKLHLRRYCSLPNKRRGKVGRDELTQLSKV
ncbi:hypothetical protein PRUPE_5G020500 [Prunus persica]|uniref:Uncharacterized protein n=1 Tax=Prunus persica TaxID=3760 RepID=A0A251P2D8_PRUPE|nr:hypothetical protein PRUPE_5G020500 [Prunus persica]